MAGPGADVAAAGAGEAAPIRIRILRPTGLTIIDVRCKSVSARSRAASSSYRRCRRADSAAATGTTAAHLRRDGVGPTLGEL